MTSFGLYVQGALEVVQSKLETRLSRVLFLRQVLSYLAYSRFLISWTGSVLFYQEHDTYPS